MRSNINYIKNDNVYTTTLSKYIPKLIKFDNIREIKNTYLITIIQLKKNQPV